MQDVAAELLAWFDREKRDLPWRRTRDPYAIWISEAMLQQTRVETVVPYWQRFMTRFPTAKTLAEAPIDDVLSAWAGLGYYRRARALHLCAREIAASHDGALPSSVDALRALPGIGDYTAGAIASMAFDVATPAIDGNVNRVLARLTATEPSDARGRKAIRAACEALVPTDRPGDFNQALMELGATVCTPRSPRCGECPWAARCRARAEGRQATIPAPKVRREVPRVPMVAAVVAEKGAVLLGRRPLDGLFGGLWEPPVVEGSLRAASAAFRRAGIDLVETKPERSVVHVLTHRVLEVRVTLARRSEANRKLPAIEPYTELAFVRRASLEDTPMSTLARRLLRVSFADA